jgi:serine/threonine protein phosphatase PrpC
MRQPRPRDHQEIDIGGAAGVTDRGLHHHRNEDALYLKATDDQSVVVVVCDGVSSSVDPDVASQTAVDVAGAMLLDAVASPPDELAHAISEAVGAAQDAILAIPWTPQADLGGPSCTLVSAVIHDGTITVAWVGDSRAYWVGPDGARQLTEDDSWAAAQVAAGIMTAEEASANPQAHAITRWLGEDAPPEGPHLRTFHPETPGRLLVCSDGLWNYAPAPEDLDRLMGGAPPDATTLRVAQALTKFALSAGGHDNITVAVVDVGVRSTKGAE